MIKIFKIGLLLCLLAVLSGCNKDYKVVQISNRKVVVEIADDTQEVVKGLSGRENLGKNNGMLFVFSDKKIRSFWMKNMNFPLDIIWIDNNTVVKISQNLPPQGESPKQTYSSEIPVNFVLEVNAGWVFENKIKTGDKIKIL